MKYISLNWTLALKFLIGKKKRMRDCRILMAHDCMYNNGMNSFVICEDEVILIISFRSAIPMFNIYKHAHCSIGPF